ncbi:hypothetical protein I79_023259 [Cricetulus griseus]|uniref:Uncharacterized protein n=1 Tax=Cricetulus griseus TaxID=10029 RepID=G3IHG9_CRIGR|nr:hypothetical protein I79_023259 [Cricetulus griseus]
MCELHTYRSKKTKEEATVVTQVKYNDDLEQHYCNGASTVKQLYSEYILRVKPIDCTQLA